VTGLTVLNTAPETKDSRFSFRPCVGVATSLFRDGDTGGEGLNRSYEVFMMASSSEDDDLCKGLPI
jgi:hypothetical protein